MKHLILTAFIFFTQLADAKYIIDFIDNKIIIENTITGRIKIITIKQEDINNGKVKEIVKQAMKEYK